jgi:hypothetical protein
MVENILPLQKAAQYWRYILSQASHSYSYFSFRKFEFINFFHMERIVIEVADGTAKKWEDVPPKIKSRLGKNFEQQIEIISQGIKDAEFKMLLDKVSEEAAQNGLTEEILAQLLKDE